MDPHLATNVILSVTVISRGEAACEAEESTLVKLVCAFEQATKPRQAWRFLSTIGPG
jgi:hypothetical protein